MASFIVKRVVNKVNRSVSVQLFVVFSQPLYSVNMLVPRPEPTGPQRPIISSVTDVLVCWALVASSTLSAYGEASFGQMCLLCH